MGMGNPEPPWFKDINVDSQQQESIQAIQQNSRKNTEELRQQIFQADGEMHSLLAGKNTLAKLRQQHQKIQKLRQKLDDQHFEMVLAIDQILTLQQRQQVEKLMQQRKLPIPPE
jgi:Spy/CpxP family protein refolding chaperone